MTQQQPPGGFPPPPGYPPPPGQPQPGFSPPPGYPPGSYGAPPTTWQPPPEQPGPAPGVQFAPHGERLIAYIIDSLILTGVMLVVVFASVLVVVGAVSRPSDGAALAAPMVLLTLAAVFLSLAYFPFFWARGGQTPGMKPFGLYVVRDADGGPVGAGRAVLRLVGYWVNSIALYIGWIWVFVDARRRGWHDLIAGTVVIKR